MKHSIWNYYIDIVLATEIENLLLLIVDNLDCHRKHQLLCRAIDFRGVSPSGNYNKLLLTTRHCVCSANRFRGLSPSGKCNQLLSTTRCGCHGTSDSKLLSYVACRHSSSKKCTGEEEISNTVNYCNME
jgi:hypothetical protein